MYKLLINGFPNISSAKIKLFKLHIGNYMLSKTKELQYTRTTSGTCVFYCSRWRTHITIQFKHNLLRLLL